MGKIFCVMGKSASGKDTIYRRLMEAPGLGLERIVLYTTRPIREGEAEGREYHFVDSARYEALLAAGKVIEARSYDTMYGVWTYFTAEEGIDLAKTSYLTIGTLESYEKLKSYFGENFWRTALIFRKKSWRQLGSTGVLSMMTWNGAAGKYSVILKKINKRQQFSRAIRRIAQPEKIL